MNPEMSTEGLPAQRGLGDRIAAVLRAGRHPIRATAMGLAALAVGWGIASGAALTAAAAGAVAGVLVGEILARTRLRSSVMLGACALLLLLGWQGLALAGRSTILPILIGPGSALALGATIRFGVLAFSLVAALRLLAARHRAMVGVELAAVAAGFAALFSSHRDGIVARPLWLSDWAWQHGYDPVHIFLGIGGVSVVVLAGLLVAESRRGISFASLLALPILVLMAISVLDVRGLPEPEAGNDLGLTDAEVGDPPLPTPEGGVDAGGQGQGGQGGGQGQQQQQQGQGGGQGQQQQGQGGGQGQQGQQQQGQGGGQGQQGQQEQGQGGGQGQQEQGQGGGQGQQQQQGGQGGGQSQQEPDLENQQSSSDSAPAPMAIVLLGDDYSPPSGAFYLRQEAWSHFNGSRLIMGRRPDVDLDTIRSHPGTETQVREPPPEDGRALVHATVSLVVTHARPFALEGLVSMAPEANPNPARFKRAYRFEARAQAVDYPALFGHAAGNPAWDPGVRQYYLEGPTDPRYGELAREIVAELPEARRADPFTQAVKIKLWMDEHLTYSTNERHAGVSDPTADFLFGNRIGYCVHFAHAAVYLWRSLGIPARIGTGYHVGEDARRGSALVVRSGDAHAWPELYLEGFGWVILDISPAQNLDPPGQPMDEDLSKLLADMARQQPDPQADQSTEPQAARSFGGDIAWALLWALLGALVVLYGRKIWRRLAPRFAPDHALPRLGYRLALDLLAEIGETRTFGETRERFARRVAARLPAFVHLTALHVAAKMGDPRQDPAARTELRREVWWAGLRALRTERAAAVPALRRVLGLLDPTSFLRAR